MGNQNADLQRQYGNNWSVRITSDDGDPGKVLLGDFQDEDRPVPVVVATSDLLTTGVDVPTAKHIVFLTEVKSRSRFKQMVGRGTRLDLERDKEFFTIVDFRGVTQMFADPGFDGRRFARSTSQIPRIPGQSTSLRSSRSPNRATSRSRKSQATSKPKPEGRSGHTPET